MTIEEIKELIHVVHETGIAELEVQRGDSRVRIRRSAAMGTQEFGFPPSSGAFQPPPPSHPASLPPNQTAQLPSGPQKADDGEEDRNTIIKSPIVGTYYDSPAPGEPTFVKVGDRVEPRQVLCIIESMKLMNEIESEISGTVVAKLVENGRPVEYGESLFSIRPN